MNRLWHLRGASHWTHLLAIVILCYAFDSAQASNGLPGHCGRCTRQSCEFDKDDNPGPRKRHGECLIDAGDVDDYAEKTGRPHSITLRVNHKGGGHEDFTSFHWTDTERIANSYLGDDDVKSVVVQSQDGKKCKTKKEVDHPDKNSCCKCLKRSQ